MIAETKGQGQQGCSAVLSQEKVTHSIFGLGDQLSGEVGTSFGTRVVGPETLRFFPL